MPTADANGNRCQTSFCLWGIMMSHTGWVSLCALFLVGSVAGITGCSRAGGKVNEETADTSRLDRIAERDSKFAELAKNVKFFYQALQKKDWPTTYEMRTANFKHDVSKELYLSSTRKDGSRWDLKSYRILNIHMYGSAGSDHAALLIMEFRESHGSSYNLALWKNESGVWVCEEPGPTELPMLHSTRVPDCFTN